MIKNMYDNQIPYDYTVEVRNRFKGLDLIDRVPNELWMEVHDIVQETGIKTIPMEKKCKKAKWLSGEALQIAVKRREVRSKGEKERCKHLNEVVLEKTLESPLDCKEIQPVHSKGDQPWVFIGRTDVEAETPVLWPPHVKS